MMEIVKNISYVVSTHFMWSFLHKNTSSLKLKIVNENFEILKFDSFLLSYYS